MSDTARFALALDGMDGVGRVTARRLLSHFATYDELLRFPREQVLTRIKGAPRAETLVARFFDREAMDALLDQADQTLAQLHERRVEVVSLRDAAWPEALDRLPRGNRPFLFYTYGHLDVLVCPIIALFARPPFSPEAFEQAQALVQRALPEGIVPATGTAHGFDVVIHKLCYAGPMGYPSLLIAATGMAKVPAPMRPTVSASVRAGGLFVSSFPMDHGPFDHDDKERALMMAALARACVFFEPVPHTPEWHAMTWAAEAGCPVFGIAAPEHPLPATVHLLQDAVDFEWVLAAVR